MNKPLTIQAVLNECELAAARHSGAMDALDDIAEMLRIALDAQDQSTQAAASVEYTQAAPPVPSEIPPTPQPAAHPAAKPSRRPAPVKADSAIQGVLGVIRGLGQEFSTDDVRAKCPRSPGIAKIIANATQKLKAAGHIVNVRRGHWRKTDSFPTTAPAPAGASPLEATYRTFRDGLKIKVAEINTNGHHAPED